MCTVHTINLICRVEKLSELNPATMGRRRKRVVNSIRCRHTCTLPPSPPLPPPLPPRLPTFLRGFNTPPTRRGVGHFRSLRPVVSIHRFDFDEQSRHR